MIVNLHILLLQQQINTLQLLIIQQSFLQMEKKVDLRAHNYNSQIKKKTMQVQCMETQSKHKKSKKKSNARQVIKQSILHLHEIYSSKSTITPIYSIYLKVLDLTSIIWVNQNNCGKEVVDICDILNNNLILGMKLKYFNMVAGFAYLIIKYINEGSDSLTCYLNLIKAIATQKSAYSSSFSNHNSNNDLPNELMLVFQNIKSLIFVNISSISQKIEKLVEQTLSSLGKIMQWNELMLAIGQNTDIKYKVQQIFFHTCLKLLKICKFSKRNSSYKQILASYFQYIDNNQLVPSLDICKLTLDAISINEQINNEQLLNIQWTSLQKSKNGTIDKNDEEITGFIIRKCFHLLREHYEKSNFFVQDMVLVQTLNKCLTTSPYCNNARTMSVIFQCLLVIKKLLLVTNGDEWNQIGLELEHLNPKINSKNSYDDCQIHIIKVCKFVSSCNLFIQNILHYLPLSSTTRALQLKELFANISRLKKYIKKFLPILLRFTQHQIMNIWNNIINNLSVIKQQVIKRYQRKSTISFRSWILDWSFCAEIQQCIITSTEHRKACDNLYKKLQRSNLYILIGRQYLLPQQQTFTNKFTNDRPSQNSLTIDIVKFCREVDRLAEEDQMFAYWDELISMGISLWEVCGDVRSLMRVSSVLKQLIKCKNMLLVSHGCQHKHSSGKYHRMNGLYNLLNIFLKQNQINISEGQQGQILTCHLNQQCPNENVKRCKSADILRVERQRSKAEIMVEIWKQFIASIMQTQIFTFNHSVAYQSSTSSSFRQNYWNATPFYYELFAYSIAITPLIRSELTLEQRAFITKLMGQIVQASDQLFLNNIRHVYHKNVANLLQDYAYTLNNKTNNKNENKSRQEKQLIFKKKVTLTTYLQFYGSLYPNTHSLQITRQSKQFVESVDHAQASNTVVKRLNYRRSSVYMREALQWQTQLIQHGNTLSQCSPQPQINAAYAKILFIDFMYWVLHYCSIKQLAEIESLTRDILEEWLDGQIVQQFLVNIIKMCKNKISNTFDKADHKHDYIELMTQCCNKLLYLSCRSATSKVMSGGRSANNCSEERTRQERSGSKNESGGHCGGYEKMNLEFEVQEASIHISRINMLLVPFAELIEQAMFAMDGLRVRGTDANSWRDKFMQQNWSNVAEQSTRQQEEYAVKNPNRLITCLSNLIGFAYNIGHRYVGTHNTCENNGDETNVLNILCTYKLILINKIYGKWMCYHAFSQMVCMGYLPRMAHKIQQINETINNCQQQLSQSDTQIFNNHKSTNPNDKKDKDASLLQSNLILITRLYLSLLTPHTQHKLLSLLSTHPQNFSTCLKLVHQVQTLVHMHPHKPVMRTISSYIWTRSCSNESALLRYDQPILPITSPTMQHAANRGSAEGRVRGIWEYSSSQIQHSLLSLTMTRLLECFIMHGQLSEFRSILKLTFIYFIRSRNTAGILLALRSYFVRTKYLNFTSLASSNCESPDNNPSSQHPLAQHISKLDMLSICDSMYAIFSTLHPLNFNNKAFDKYCKLVLGAGNRRRTSLSFHVDMGSIAKILGDSLGKCGRNGAELIIVLGEYACKVLGLGEEYVVYKKYAQLTNNGLHQPQLRNELKEVKDYQLNSYFSKRFLQFCIHLQLKASTITSLQLQYIFIDQIRKCIPFSYNYASIIENMLTKKVQDGLDDMVVLELSVLMMDHSYSYKKMIESIQPIGINASSVEDSYKCGYEEGIKKANSKYGSFVSQYLSRHNKRLAYLISSLKYPLTIIYPLGDRIYTISVSSPLLVLHIERGQFEDYIHTVDTLIANNSRLLNNKNIDHKEWWKSRDRVDRAIGKIVNEINVPLWDSMIMENSYTSRLNVKQIQLYKLIESVIRCYGNDRKKIKNILNYSYLQITQNMIDEYLIKINEMINIQEFVIPNPQEQNQNLLLLTHHSYTLFPFQANIHLRERGVYRLPSIEYLLQQNDRGLLSKTININQLNYLVNSGNDLPETEKSFYKIKENYPEWRGIIGKRPTFKEYYQMLQMDCFLFMGHGIGSQHIKDKEFYGKNILALIMLFGCNSASVTQGKCQPNGIAHSHLINGAPGVLGCLWEVTDKDTDKMTESIFKTITDHPQNLSRIVSLAKKKCKHQCLNGGAIVLFGIPIYVHHY